MLTPLAPGEQTRFLAELHNHFRVAPFDIGGAALAARLYQDHRVAADPASRRSRKILRADTLIVASLKMAGVTTVYSHDRSCRATAERAGMIAHDLPTHSEKLFE